MTTRDEKAHLARALLDFRRSRLKRLPAGLFAEAGWEFLLELFLADAEGRKLTGQMVVNGANMSPIVASRWLKYLSAEKLVVGDGDGDLDDSLTLSPFALEQLEDLLGTASSMIREFSVH